MKEHGSETFERPSVAGSNLHSTAGKPLARRVVLPVLATNAGQSDKTANIGGIDW